MELSVAQGGRMGKIVQSLMLFSRQRKPERRAVSLPDIIRQILRLRASQLAIASSRLETDFGADVPPVQGDPYQLQQVFLNLVLNAEQAILGSGVGGRRSGDRIRVSTRTRLDGDQPWVVAQVADNGPGLPPELLPHTPQPPFHTTPY